MIVVVKFFSVELLFIITELAIIVILNSTKCQLHQEVEKMDMEAIKNGKKDAEVCHHNDWKKQKLNIASVIHDEICATLTFLLHDMNGIEKISKCSTVKMRANQCVDQLTKAMSRCRSVLLDLQPNEEGPGLTESLNYMLNKIKLISGIAVTSEINPHINQLGLEQQSVIYRTMQEALSNVTKHSHATHVHVSVKIMLGEVQVRVVDDGIGLGCSDLSPAFCIGLKMQSQRAEDLSGHFSIQDNSNGVGTKMLLSFPLDSNLI